MRLTGSLMPKRKAPAGVGKPQLTSMVDMLTILLVFLLKSFSVEGNLITTADDLVLPESSSEEAPEPTLGVEISRTSINIDGELIVPLAGIGESDSLLIAPLFSKLQSIAETTGRDGMENEVCIQCDRGLEFSVIKKVMYTCAQASYSDFSLLVIREE